MSSEVENTAKTDGGSPAMTPKLRFPEFWNAEGWEVALMSEIYSFKSNNSLSRDQLNYEHGSVKNIHYGDIHTKFSTHFDVSNETVPFINSGEALNGLRHENDCVEGDMIFADASEDLADIGKSIEVVRLNGERVVAGQHTILARPRNNSLVVGFGAYLFNSKYVRNQIKKESQGSKVLGISATRLTKIGLPIPRTKAEQQRIADCLTSVDELIAAQASQVAALKTHKKGLMQQLFPRPERAENGQTIPAETTPRLRFSEFQDAGDWEANELGTKTTKVGSGITPNGGDKNYKKAGRPFVRSQNVGWGELLLDDVAFIDEETHSSFNSTEIHALDVLINITGASIGRSAVADGRIVGGNVNQHVCLIRVKPAEMDHCYLNQFLISPEGQKQIDSFQAGGNRQGLNFAQIRSFTIPLPPQLPEQQRIADCLTSLDNLIAAHTQKLDALKTHKKGLMQQLFPVVEASEA